jgi:hypothetical protein
VCDACPRACCREYFPRAEQVQPLLQNHSRRVDSRPTFHLRESNRHATRFPLGFLSPCNSFFRLAELPLKSAFRINCRCLPLRARFRRAPALHHLRRLHHRLSPPFLIPKYTTRIRCSFYAALTPLSSPLQRSALDSRINKLIRGSLWTRENRWCLQLCSCKCCGARSCSSSFVSLSRPACL